MTDILLALCVGAAFVLGYLPMKRLDRFLEKNREAVERAEKEAPKNVPVEVRGGDVGRAPVFERGFPLVGSLRGGNLFPMRHRS